MRMRSKENRIHRSGCGASARKEEYGQPPPVLTHNQGWLGRGNEDLS
jgi:hypothetical protein